MTSSWFFLSTLNYDAWSTTHQIYSLHIKLHSITSLWTTVFESAIVLNVMNNTNQIHPQYTSSISWFPCVSCFPRLFLFPCVSWLPCVLLVCLCLFGFLVSSWVPCVTRFPWVSWFACVTWFLCVTWFPCVLLFYLFLLDTPCLWFSL